MFDDYVSKLSLFSVLHNSSEGVVAALRVVIITVEISDVIDVFGNVFRDHFFRVKERTLHKCNIT